MAVRSARRLLPWREYNENDIINLCALSGTGLAGALVKIASITPSNNYYYTQTPVGASFVGVTSNRWVNPDTVSFAGSGDGVKANGVLGLTLANVQEYDENGQRLILGYRRKADENNVVLSGETVPVLTKGLVYLNYTAYTGTPQPGYVAVVSYANGAGGFGGGMGGVGGNLIGAVPYSNIISGNMVLQQVYGNPASGINQGFYTSDAVIGRWLSFTGVERNGYALLKLEL